MRYFPDPVRHCAQKLVEAPATEPIGLALAKTHIHVDWVDEDQDIELKLKAARIAAEMYTGRKFITQKWEVYWDRWPKSRDWLVVPYGNLQSIEVFSYKLSDGTEIPLAEGANYILDKVMEPARIYAPVNGSWPSGCLFPGTPIKARIICGYANAAAVPDTTKSAIELHLGSLYTNREGVTLGLSSNIESQELVMGAKDLLKDDRLWDF